MKEQNRIPCPSMAIGQPEGCPVFIYQLTNMEMITDLPFTAGVNVMMSCFLLKHRLFTRLQLFDSLKYLRTWLASVQERRIDEWPLSPTFSTSSVAISLVVRLFFVLLVIMFLVSTLLKVRRKKMKKQNSVTPLTHVTRGKDRRTHGERSEPYSTARRLHRPVRL